MRRQLGRSRPRAMITNPWGERPLTGPVFGAQPKTTLEPATRYDWRHIVPPSPSSWD
jgi:hypothetical protein